MKRLLMLLSTLAVVGCLDATGPGPSDPASETFASSLNIGNLSDTNVWKHTFNGTYYKDEIVGTGGVLNLQDPTDSMFVDYTGYLKDGSTFDAGTNARFQVGGVILGFLDGTVGMRTGGQRYIVIPSELAYGNSTVGTIPQNSTLVFRIKLNGFYSPP